MPVYSLQDHYETFSATTRTDLVDAIKVALVNAGWSVVSGSSGSWKLESAATANGLQCRVQISDPGSGSTARLFCTNVSETISLSSGTIFLAPDAAHTWHFYGNPYFACMHVLPWPAATRKACMFGTGYTPDFFHDGSINECTASIFQHGNSTNDGGTAPTATLFGPDAFQAATQFGWVWNALSRSSSNESNATNPGIVVEFQTGGTGTPINRWAVDDSFTVHDALIHWGHVNADITSCRKRLILYDCLWMAGAVDAGTERDWDNHVWVAVGHQKNGSLYFLKSGFSPA